MKPTPTADWSNAQHAAHLEGVTNMASQATEAELHEAAAMMAMLWSPRSSYRRNPWPWRR